MNDKEDQLDDIMAFMQSGMEAQESVDKETKKSKKKKKKKKFKKEAYEEELDEYYDPEFDDVEEDADDQEDEYVGMDPNADRKANWPKDRAKIRKLCKCIQHTPFLDDMSSSHKDLIRNAAHAQSHSVLLSSQYEELMLMIENLDGLAKWWKEN